MIKTELRRATEKGNEHRVDKNNKMLEESKERERREKVTYHHLKAQIYILSVLMVRKGSQQREASESPSTEELWLVLPSRTAKKS